MNADRYQNLRRRLRLTKPEIAVATGYSLGYVNRWGHSGESALQPPAAAIDRLAALLRERALRDLADTDRAG
ncbi:hypothetical protein Sa4125_29900 [Aureimonas sp. SA4125]|uniref:hypothetical protein n=1 Tax=Aureimonas sp. SA4125 TaxID=2826993 RepID=UPI001CC396E9|nr:hypothetical protein [Aureimonas sp. SA4125]BDA85448.1 hypothetical protein Sa4125_29900 [Aureimonas sp. SA4125]